MIKALDGKKPMFFGAGGVCHPKIREKMFEILIGKDEYEILDQPSQDEIADLRSYFGNFNVNNIHTERPLMVAEKNLTLYSFTGTRVNQTIGFLLR